MGKNGSLSPYLYFDGNCLEAVNYYAAVFELDPPDILKYSKGDYPMEVTEAEEGLVMYATLAFENMNLMFSDDPISHPAPTDNAMIVLNWSTSDPDLYDRVWSTMAKDGSIQTECSATFFAQKFGVIKDPYGLFWQLGLNPMETTNELGSVPIS